MPVPFRDADEVDALGTAGYLKIDTSADGNVFRGALFIINARGEPIEFIYNKIETPNTFLWRQDDIRRHAVRMLTTSLLAICPKIPYFILCLADEIYSELFCDEVRLSIPVCRVAPAMNAAPHSSLEALATIDGPEPAQLFWFPGKPAGGSVEHRLFDRLVTHGLLLEPFERALTGLREVYNGLTGESR